MLEVVWPPLPAAFRNELILQCVRHLKGMPDDYEAFARLVGGAINARPQSVKSQWRMADTFGTMRALGREPRLGAPFFAVTYMAVRKPDLTALYSALGVSHKDLEVDESSAVQKPPTEAQFASALSKGVDQVSTDSLLMMIAIIAAVGIEAWQAPANAALTKHLAAKA
jgi:hypothetical protein